MEESWVIRIRFLLSISLDAYDVIPSELPGLNHCAGDILLAPPDDQF
jgi:hypothetical protein